MTAAEEADLITEVPSDDDLDMRQVGKPLSGFKPITTTGTGNLGATVLQPDEVVVNTKKEMDSKRTAKQLWDELDKEIADVSDGDGDDPDDDPLPAESGEPSPTGATDHKTSRRTPAMCGLMDVGVKPKEGPKNHSFENEDGEASARVYDTPELRAAFLHYANSSIKVSEMALVHEGPFMQSQQFVGLCKDYRLLEPEGKLSFIMAGIIYTTSKSDDAEGLAFGQFLDALVSLAFECETNVAADLQAEWDKKVAAQKAAEALVQPKRRVRHPEPVSDSGSNSPGTRTPDESGAPLPRKKENKTRFQGVPTLCHSSVLDKMTEMSKIKSLAVSRATSVINSRVASHVFSRPAFLGSAYHTSDEDDDEDDQPAKLARYVNSALAAYTDSVGDEPQVLSSPLLHAGCALTGRTHTQMQTQMMGGVTPPSEREAVLPLFAGSSTAGALLHTVRASASGGGAGASVLRATTARRVSPSTEYSRCNDSEGGAGTDHPSLRPSPSTRQLSQEMVNKGFGDDTEEDAPPPLPSCPSVPLPHCPSQISRLSEAVVDTDAPSGPDPPPPPRGSAAKNTNTSSPLQGQMELAVSSSTSPALRGGAGDPDSPSAVHNSAPCHSSAPPPLKVTAALAGIRQEQAATKLALGNRNNNSLDGAALSSSFPTSSSEPGHKRSPGEKQAKVPSAYEQQLANLQAKYTRKATDPMRATTPGPSPSVRGPSVLDMRPSLEALQPGALPPPHAFGPQTSLTHLPPGEQLPFRKTAAGSPSGSASTSASDEAIPGDDKLAAVMKRRLAMEAKLAAIEQRFRGPQPPAGLKPRPPPGLAVAASPRGSNAGSLRGSAAAITLS